jgi:hypothetical protein
MEKIKTLKVEKKILLWLNVRLEHLELGIFSEQFLQGGIHIEPGANIPTAYV